MKGTFIFTTTRSDSVYFENWNGTMIAGYVASTSVSFAYNDQIDAMSIAALECPSTCLLPFT